jgi:hypothetical protein
MEELNQNDKKFRPKRPAPALIAFCRRAHTQNVFRAGLLLGLPILLFAPALGRIDQFGPINDFSLHARYTREWFETQKLTTPHFLNSALTIACKWAVPAISAIGLEPLSYIDAELIVAQAMYVLAAIVIYCVLRWCAPTAAAQHPNWLLLAGLTLLLVGPITLFTLVNNNLYTGYFPPANVYHNPTTLALKPFALATVAAVAVFLGPPASSNIRLGRWSLLLAALVILMTLAKPSYTICLVPALLLLVALDAGLRRSGRAWLAVAVIGVAGILVLAWQYWLVYGQPGSNLIFYPFLMVRDPEAIAWLKFSMSIAFPAGVAVFYFRRVRENIAFRLGWLCFAISCLYYFLLAEGARTDHNNFGWGCQVALFVLFVLSFGVLLEDGAAQQAGTSPPTPLAYATCWSLFGMHLTSGLLFYFSHLNGTGTYWY